MKQKDKTEGNKDKPKFLERNVAGIVFVGIVLILTLPFILTRATPNVDWWPSFLHTGEIGDTIGGISAPIIGVITILLVYLTYNSQKKELAETKSALEKQNTISQGQQFESIFFNMLHQLETISSNCKIQQPGIMGNYESIISGNDYFKIVVEDILKNLRMDFFSERSRASDTMGDQSIAGKKIFEAFSVSETDTYSPRLLRIKDLFLDTAEVENIEHMRDDLTTYMTICYNSVYQEHSQHLGHFFRYLHNLIEFVKNSQIANRKFYFNILQAQLSDPQLALIFYNGISRISNNKEDKALFRDNIDQNNFLENLDSKYIISKAVAQFFYPMTTFKYLSDEKH